MQKRVLRALRMKLAHYCGEVGFALRAPATTGDRLRLIGQSAAFHVRNWRKALPNATPRMTVRLRLCGRELPVTLRPHDADLGILHEIFARHSYRIPESLLPPESVTTIVDAGANIGLASLYLADRYRQARIIAVEPHPGNAQLMRANTAGIGRIVPVQAAVTPAGTAKVFIATTGRASHFQTTSRAAGVAARGLTLQQLMAEHGIGQIDLLKIDVEGAEAAIFAQADFLERTGVIAAELHGGYDLGRFNADIAAYGFVARPSPFTHEPGLVIAARPRQGAWPP